MRCISFVIFLTFSSCFLALPALENVTQAEEIELLERKLEYLRAKKELDLELEIVKAKLQKLNQDYSDVVDAKTAVSASSPSEASETDEPEATVEDEPEPVGRTWSVTDLKGTCVEKHKLKLDENTIQVNPDSSFSFSAYVTRDRWKGRYTGNLENNKLKMRSNTGSWLGDHKIEKDGKQWTFKIENAWTSDSCHYEFRLE